MNQQQQQQQQQQLRSKKKKLLRIFLMMIIIFGSSCFLLNNQKRNENDLVSVKDSCASARFLSFVTKSSSSSSSSSSSVAFVSDDEIDVDVIRLRDAVDRKYSSGHWFHVSEFHLHAHSRILSEIISNSRSRSRSSDDGNMSGSNIIALIVPSEEFLRDLKPMTRFLLAISYSFGMFRELGYVSPGKSKDSLKCEMMIGQSRFSKTSSSCALNNAFVVSRMQPLRERFVKNFYSVSSCTKKQYSSNSEYDIPVKVEFRNVEALANYAYARNNDGDEKIKTLLEASFGGIHVDRGAWMPNEGDSASIRRTIKNVCKPSPIEEREEENLLNNDNGDSLEKCVQIALRMSSSSNRKKLAIIYNRNAGREIDDVFLVREKLEALLNKEEESNEKVVWEVLVLTHDDKNPPCLLSKCVGSASLVVTPHGFQSMLAIFMSENSLLYEAFPSRYYKHGYKRLALEFSLAHGFTQSKPVGFVSKIIAIFFTTDACMKMYYCRYLARKASVNLLSANDNVISNSNDVDKIVQAVMLNEHRETGDANSFVLLSENAQNRVQCNWLCSSDASCQKYAFDDKTNKCHGRIDRFQTPRANDVIGAGIYDQKCFVIGC